MKILRITLLAGMVAIAAGCKKSDTAELKSSNTKTNNKPDKQLVVDSVLTTRLVQAGGIINYQDDFYISQNDTKLGLISHSTEPFIIKRGTASIDNNRIKISYTRNKANVTYDIGFSEYPNGTFELNYHFVSKD